MKKTVYDQIPGKHAGSSSHPVRISLEALAKTGPSDSCTLACFRMGSIWTKPETVSQDQMSTLGVMATTGCNQNTSKSDPAYLLFSIR